MRRIEIKLKKLLKEKNMTQLELAEKANIRPSAISSLTRGYVDRLSIEHLEKICEALELTSLNQLIDLEEK